MAKLRINGRELLVKPINQARNRDLIELQVQSGLKSKEIQERAGASEFFAQVILSFLTQHNAGFRVKYDDLLDGSLADLGELIIEPGDPGQEAEAEAEANPTQAASGTPEASTPQDLGELIPE
jgi:hypothetical protein